MEKQIENIILQITIAISSGVRSTWVRTPVMSVYFRNTKRMVHGKIIPTIDVAVIAVAPGLRNKGYCSLFLSELTKTYPDKNIYVESVINPVMERICIKTGFSLCGNNNFIKLSKTQCYA